MRFLARPSYSVCLIALVCLVVALIGFSGERVGTAYGQRPGEGGGPPGVRMSGTAAAAPAAPVGDFTAVGLVMPTPQKARPANHVTLTPEQEQVVRDAAALLRANATQSPPPAVTNPSRGVPPLALSMALTKSAELTRGLDLSGQTFIHEYWALFADSALQDVIKRRPDFPARQLIMACQTRPDWEPFFWRWAVGEMLGAPINARLMEMPADVAWARDALVMIRRLSAMGIRTPDATGKILPGQSTDVGVKVVADMITRALAPEYDPANLPANDERRSPLMLKLAEGYLEKGDSWWVTRSYSGTQWPPQPTAGWPSAGFVAEQAQAWKLIYAQKMLNKLHSGLLPSYADVQAYSSWAAASTWPKVRPKLTDQYATLERTDIEAGIAGPSAY